MNDARPALGANFRWLVTTSGATNLADGVLLAAGPLLVAEVSLEPAAVAAAVFLQRLPWILFGFVAGALIDRMDRRRLLVVANAARAVVLALLAAALGAGWLSLPVVYTALFLIGTAESFADNAADTIVAVAVPRDALGRANARLRGVHTVTNQLAGPPLGALLLGIGLVVPFAANAVLMAAAAVLIMRVRLPERARAADATPMRVRVAEGMRWLWRHDAVRTLAMLIAVFNITFGAVYGVLVVYALEQLGLGETGFGLFLSAGALGGVLGSVVFERLERRVSYATMLRVGLVIETGTHLALLSTTSPWVAGGVWFVFGVHAVVWGTIAQTIRHRAVPEELLSRVTSVYYIGLIGSLAIGTAIGGAIAQRFGLSATFLFAGVGAGVTTALVWRQIGMVADAGT